jgi:hypothetical protein
LLPYAWPCNRRSWLCYGRGGQLFKGNGGHGPIISICSESSKTSSVWWENRALGS